MKRTLAILVCLLMLASLPGAACWMYLSIEEMENQAEVIVIGELTGEVREVTRGDGTGVTYWSLNIEHVLRGDVAGTMEVATGGLVSQEGAEHRVMLSTDYRLDSHGQLFLLYLHDDYDNGSSWPITPRAIVQLKRQDGGEIFGAYDISSTQHEEDHADIMASIKRLERSMPRASVLNTPSAPPKIIIPALAAVGTVSLAAIAIKRR